MHSQPELRQVKFRELLAGEDVLAAAHPGQAGDILDIWMEDPGTEFAQLYRLLELREDWEFGVTLPASLGFEKAVRLAASLGLPIRILPGQFPAETLPALEAVADFYLHDWSVEAPIEPFHWLFTRLRGFGSGTIGMVLDSRPPAYARTGDDCRLSLPFLEREQPARMLGNTAECAGCPWQGICGGYFKWPDPAYPCTGAKHLFKHLKEAADDIGMDMAALQAASTSSRLMGT